MHDRYTTHIGLTNCIGILAHYVQQPHCTCVTITTLNEPHASFFLLSPVISRHMSLKIIKPFNTFTLNWTKKKSIAKPKNARLDSVACSVEIFTVLPNHKIIQIIYKGTSFLENKIFILGLSQTSLLSISILDSHSFLFPLLHVTHGHRVGRVMHLRCMSVNAYVYIHVWTGGRTCELYRVWTGMQITTCCLSLFIPSFTSFP